MKFTFVRIDDRLIHGQVALGWTRSKSIECILAVDDATAKDSFKSSLMKMATPPGVKSFIVTEEKALEKINNGDFDKKKTMLLVRKPATLVSLLEKGVSIDEVNVGNLRTDGGTKVLAFVYVTDAEIADLKAIRKHDIHMFGQSLPDQQLTNLDSIIDEL